MKVLAIGAHPDDIEIFMFGLLAKLKTRGDDIFTIIVTDGSKGGAISNKLLKDKRKKEAISGLKNLSSPIFLNFPDGNLGNDQNHKNIIEKNIMSIMPDLIITHSENDYHADHRSLSCLISNTVSHYIPILYCDTLMGINFQPNYYVDITNHFTEKHEAILEHHSQDPQRFADLATLMNSFRAAQCNSPKGFYVEAYSFVSSFPFTDIRGMLPSPPKIRPFHITNNYGFL